MTMRALFALAMLATPAMAETPCLPTLDAYAAALENDWGEVPQIVGTMQRGAAFLIFANPATGTWTVVVQSPDGRYCSPASGANFIAAKQGEPA